MWSKNLNTSKWEEKRDKLPKKVYNSLRQDLEDLIFYSKCLDGTSYLPINNLDNVYDVFKYDSFDNLTWYIDSIYSNDNGDLPINNVTIEDYKKYSSEYGLTLKNLFTPQRTINDSLNNFLTVDVSTTEEIEFLTDSKPGLRIDGIRLKDNHRILVKDQISRITLPNNTNPDDYFKGNYYIINVDSNTTTYFFYNSENGIYKYINNKLVRENDLDIYDDVIRYSIYVKLGNENKENQYHLSRLKNGFYPLSENNEPIEFLNKKNWLLRNKVEYQNILDINIKDSLKNDIEIIENYTIPKRSIYVGEFGSIFIHQDEHTNFNYTSNPGFLNIVENEVKNDLNAITQTNNYYWVVGEMGTLLKINKVDLSIELIELDILFNLNSISFFNQLRGIIVGDFNQIWFTLNGGRRWSKLNIQEFDNFKYNKVIFNKLNEAIIIGDNGVLIELTYDGNSWDYTLNNPIRRESINDDFELVRNLNDIIEIETTTWGLSYISSNNNVINSNKSFYLIVGDDNLLMVYDRNNFIVEHDYLFLNLNQNIGNIKNVININDNIYLISDNHYKFNLNIFSDVDNISNEISTNTLLDLINSKEYNNISRFNNEIELVGDNLTLDYYNSIAFPININTRVNTIFEDKLKSKLLFLDYDMGSKLNFFGDDLEYRLPNEEEIPICIGTSSQSTIEFSSLSGEESWIDYHRDKLKDFEYGTSLNTSNEILYNTEFRYGMTPSIYYDNTDITNDFNEIEDLLNSNPNVNTNDDYQVFIYDKYTVFTSPTNINHKLGDIIKVDCDILSGKFMIIKLIEVGNTQYVYMRTNFNETISKNIIEKSQTITFNNLNIYVDQVDFIEIFHEHYLGISYEAILGDPYVENSMNCNDILFKPKYDEKNAYYNLSINIEDTTFNESVNLKYNELFLNFQYTATYNILDYLNNINPIFTQNKEFLTMPQFTNIPVNNSGVVINGNKISFNSNLKFEWESFWEKTFIDVNIDGNLTEKCFIIKKYYDSNIDRYIIDLHKEINLPLSPDNISILSRRTLFEISKDLNEINNIQTNIKNSPEGNFTIYEKELNFKFNTDSYAKILLSDIEIKDNLTAIMFTDYKNDISLNIIDSKKQDSLDITIESIPTVDGLKAKVITSSPHNLNIGDEIIIEESSGDYSGFHTVRDVISNDQFTTNIDFISQSSGTIIIPLFDPYLSYIPSDIIDVGIDAKSKISVAISPNNVINNDDNTSSLVNLDLNNFKFNLIDGLYLDILVEKYPWVLEAEITNATIGIDDNGPIFYSGIWYCGRWFEGTWYSGIWLSGQWYGGEWNSNKVKLNKISAVVDTNTINNKFSQWYGGNHHSGTWNGGTWYNGRWIDGEWNNGIWFFGQWDQGTWNNGEFNSGIWIFGTWNNGRFNSTQGESIWIDGTWYGGDFESGTWMNGKFTQKEGSISRFGTNPTNSRKAIWKSGGFFLGEFHSILNQDNDGNTLPSLNHKYSIWETGKWSNGTFFGGTSFNIVWDNGTWGDGISKDISILEIYNNYYNEGIIKLSGVYNFNRNDEFFIIDNIDTTNNWQELGTNEIPKSFLVKDIEIESINNIETNTFITLYNSIPNIPIQPTATLEILSGNNGDVIDIYYNSISPSNLIASTLFNVNPLQTATDIVEEINTNNNGFTAFNNDGENEEIIITKTQEGASFNGTPLVLNTPVSYNSSSNFSGGVGTYSTIKSTVVSRFKGTDWQNGLWYNGIFEGDIFQSGMWISGSFLNGEFL